MADYYPALFGTVSSLANNNALTRQELYEYARSNIVAQLRRRDLQISALEIVRERAALETAIHRVEAVFAGAYTPRFLAQDRRAAAVSDDNDDTGVRGERSTEDEVKARPAPALSEEINASKIRGDEYTPALEPRPANIRSWTPDDRRRRGVDDRSAIMRRGRDLIGMYTAALGDPITGPVLIGIALAAGMMAFTGLLYAAIILTVRLAL